MDDKDNKNKTKDNNFQANYKTISTFKGKVNNIYSGDGYLRQGFGSGRDQRLVRGNTLAEEIASATTPEQLRNISIKAMSNQGYADMVNYFKTMYHYRYTVVPVAGTSTKNASKESILTLSKEMLEIVESANIEAIFPNVLETGMFEGMAVIYLEKKGQELSTFILPNKYCKPFLSSSYGTTTVVFDLNYFDDILSSLQGANDVSINKKQKENKDKKEEEKELQRTILALYPKEIRIAYLAYKGLDERLEKKSNKEKSPQHIHLDASKAALIPFSPSLAPPKIKVSAAEERYEEAVETHAKKQKAGLDKIFTHEIPHTADGDLLMEYNEVKDMQSGMTKALAGEADIKVVTTFGPTKLHDVQTDGNVRSTIVKDAMDSQYQTAAMNPEMFRANTDYALEISLGRNSAFVWDMLQMMVNFYNLSINQQFNFGDYSCHITLLPITVYNEDKKIELYRRAAEYGMGKLEAIVATGQKQISLLDKLKLEEALDLDNLLTPLQSSHTRSSKEQAAKPVSEEKEKVGVDSSEEDKKETKEVEDEK